MALESDLASDRLGIGGCASPVAVGLGSSFESLDLQLLGGGGRRAFVSGRDDRSAKASSGGIQALPGALKFAGVEGWRVVEGGLLAGVEFGEFLVAEVVEVSGHVAVGLQARVTPGGSSVGSRDGRPGSEHGGVIGDLAALAVGGYGGGGGQPGRLVGRVERR